MFCVGSFFMRVNCLFGAVSLTKNADIDKYKYFRYRIGFYRGGSFSFQGSNIIIFGGDMSSSVHVDNKEKDILILGKDPTQRLRQHSLTQEKMYLINLTDHSKKLFKIAL